MPSIRKRIGYLPSINAQETITKIANKEKIGDVSTLEDGAAVEEVQSAFNELQNAINKNN